MQLLALGIPIGGQVRIGSAPANAVELLRFEGRPMSEIVRLFMKWSNNTVAEALVKALGAREGTPGSWKNGVVAVRKELDALGIPLADSVIVDGSGLAYQNALTPRTLVEALRTARASFAIGPEFTAALPIAARDGTLEQRANGAQGVVRAKTGSLNRTTALSGFAELPDGQIVVFSILANGYRVSDDVATAALDSFAAALVTR
jgi:D-alanyl-D-alanine carboxypeptidase/D-alanyl-D-alanine-endopeptidase (penicillin-binding protein 4)